MDFDEFSDDGLDDLPDNALQELENNAISFTQAQAQHHAAGKPPQQPSQDASRAYSDYGWDEDEDLDTSEVINRDAPAHSRPVAANAIPPQQPLHQQNPPPRRPNSALLNPGWHPAVDPSKGTSPALGMRPGYPKSGSAHAPIPVGSQRPLSQRPLAPNRPPPSQFVKPPLPSHLAPSQQPLASQSLSQSSQSHPNNVVTALQQRVRALEMELNSARGEVSILRTNSTRAVQQHTDELARLKKASSEQIQQKERMVEKAVSAERTASTELQFLQQDIREASSNRPRRAPSGSNKNAVSGEHGQDLFTTTPKKGIKTWGMADGFDEMEISSPSKGQGRGRNGGPVAANVGERTPSKGKRKRPAVDSPIAPLETDYNDGEAMVLDKTPAQQAAFSAPNPGMTPTPLLGFLQLALDHAAYHDQSTSFDVLSRFAFPSEPNVSLATIIFQRLPMMGNPHRPLQLLVDFAEHIISLWRRCLEEAYWDPVKYLISLVSFTFQLNTTSVAPFVIPNLTIVCQTTMRSLAEWRHKLPEGDLLQNEEYSFLEQHVDTAQILSLLYSSALSCVTWIMDADSAYEPQIMLFWRLMSLDSVMLLLTPGQKPEDVIAMLDLLATSSLPDSIGPITEDADSDSVAKNVIERVCAKLTETPRCAATPSEKRAIRSAALKTMIAFSKHPFGASQLAVHNNAFPRLVTCLSDAIDDLYDQPIPSTILPQPDDEAEQQPAPPSAPTDLYKIVAQCVNLMHFLVTDPATANKVETSQKLSVYFASSHRHMIALARLTFAEEDGVIEAGIDSEVVELAHEMLELAVTPDDGPNIEDAFGGT